MNPRYLVYCRAHGLEPEAMLAFDRTRAPGGHMGPFIRWVSARWEEWRREHGRQPMSPVCDKDHTHFNAWLDAQTMERLALVRLLAALHADSRRLIALILTSCGDDEDDVPRPKPAKARARKTTGQCDLF